MKKVQIVRGTYGHRPINDDGTLSKSIKPVTAKSPPISVRNEEADRLMALGVGKVVEDVENPVKGVATTLGDADSNALGANPELDESDLEVIADALELPRYSMDWTADELKELMEELGLPVTSRMTKAQMIDAIDAVFGCGELEGDEE